MPRSDGTAGPRLYELRLTRIADARHRYQIARSLAHRFPSQDVSAVAAALGGPGFVTRVELRDEEVPGLARELYAAGVPPAALILLPADRHVSRDEADGAADRGFARFARRGGRFVPTWNWGAFVFGPLWYLRKGLYGKGLLLLGLGLVPIWTLPVTLLTSLGILVYSGLCGNWDYYLWKVKRTQWW
ncbi:MAG TPA: DUF2628 domain-containing protein [Methylomirabilota bacterium]|nr:DUF2628 domain-containing protein [Methylomirabilota bacterium]